MAPCGTMWPANFTPCEGFGHPRPFACKGEASPGAFAKLGSRPRGHSPSPPRLLAPRPGASSWALSHHDAMPSVCQMMECHRSDSLIPR